MAVTTIPWGDGSGDNIYLSASSQVGDETVQVSSDANTGAARSQTVTFTSGVGGITRSLTVNQEAGGSQEYTLTVNFSSVDSDHSYASISNTSNAYRAATASTTTYCQINPKTGNYAETYVYFKFDTSALPANATIVSVECKANFYKPSGATTTRFSALYATMCSGTTEKGTAIDIPNNTNVKTFSPGTWTRAELSDVRVKIYAQRTTSNTGTNYGLRIYGGTLTIKYTL